MKLGIFFLALATLMPVAAQAQNQKAQQESATSDRWCRYEGLDHGSLQVCSAYTYEQCMASRNPGDTICFLNPRYDPRSRR